ncbi:MAG: SDR family oxidoreductase [Proteobacteria bacterium]|nr:SDR family oxidoreductase [Pseudomonadota bacterium]
MDLQLRGRTALVTGAYRGTGRAIAEGLAREGVQVWLHGFDRSATEAACQGIENARPLVNALDSDEAIAELLATLGAQGLDILVNNYGRASRGQLTPFKLDAWLEMYEVNVLSAARLSSALLPKLEASKAGRIIHLGTIGALKPAAENPHYYAAKGALATLTVSMAQALAGTRIRVNLVAPGIIRTEEVVEMLTRRARQEGLATDWASVEAHATRHWYPNLLGRLAEREEVADLVTFLASDRAAFLHGQLLRIDGGAIPIVS